MNASALKKHPKETSDNGWNKPNMAPTFETGSGVLDSGATLSEAQPETGSNVYVEPQAPPPDEQAKGSYDGAERHRVIKSARAAHNSIGEQAHGGRGDSSPHTDKKPTEMKLGR